MSVYWNTVAAICLLFAGTFSVLQAAAQQSEEEQLNAIVDATRRILQENPDAARQEAALSRQFHALARLVDQYDASRASELTRLADQLAQDRRPQLQKLPAGRRLQASLLAAGRRASAGTLPADELLAVSEQLIAYLDKYGPDLEALNAAQDVGRLFESADNPEVGARLLENISTAMVAADDPQLVAEAEVLRAAARRLRLPGNELQLEGRLADGSAFDWKACRGKVVLVDFWASWCSPCVAELPVLKRYLRIYGDRGLKIVGVSLDGSREDFEQCVAKHGITWPSIVAWEDIQNGGRHPIAEEYGIRMIPSAILVDADGKVISLRARGKILDQLLEHELGPATEKSSESARSDKSDSSSDTDEGDSTNEG